MYIRVCWSCTFIWSSPWLWNLSEFAQAVNVIHGNLSQIILVYWIQSLFSIEQHFRCSRRRIPFSKLGHSSSLHRYRTEWPRATQHDEPRILQWLRWLLQQEPIRSCERRQWRVYPISLLFWRRFWIYALLPFQREPHIPSAQPACCHDDSGWHQGMTIWPHIFQMQQTRGSSRNWSPKQVNVVARKSDS